MLEIHAQSIDHNQHRYDTVGDYATVEGIECFYVSKLEDERYEHLILIHEIIERVLCHHAGIDNYTIDMFDMEFENKRADNVARGLIDPNAEPGDSPDAPYYRQHQIATTIERLLAVYLGVDWQEYERAIRKLVYRPTGEKHENR